jgi:hypothetical protein
MALIALALSFVGPEQLAAQGVQTNTSFTFAFGGDTGYYGNDTTGMIASHKLISADFFINLGDISYNGTTRYLYNPPTGNEGDWCNFVKQYVHNRLGQPAYPYEIVAGNHEDGTDPQKDGYIDSFIACLPNQFSNFVGSGLCDGTSTCYGKEGYFDYPTDHPMARFILISNALRIGSSTANETYDYCPLDVCQKPRFDQHYQWLKQSIEAAKALGYWVIIVQHKPCLSPDIVTFCEGMGIYNGNNPGAQLLSLEVSERVDLVLSGHAHAYARSKQLSCYGSVQPNDDTPPVYESSCVVNVGSAGTYERGAGMVQIIQGDFSQRDGQLNFTRPDIDYFVTAMSARGTITRSVPAVCCWVNGQPVDVNSGNGIGVITVTPQQLSFMREMSIQSHLVPSGSTFGDSFTIGGSITPSFWPAIIIYGIIAAVVVTAAYVGLRIRRRTRARRAKTPVTHSESQAHEK